jgi:predicted alpha/beta-hydrolase family hydrolase
MPTPKIHFDGSRKSAKWRIALAHSAGTGMRNEFMDSFAEQLAARDFLVARFEFPYMEQRAVTGRRRPPDPEPVLLDAWRAVIETLGPKDLIIGGKSMGGRMAATIADETGVTACICLGYPFHPTGKPNDLRLEPLQKIEVPTLILQGALDTFGDKKEVEAFTLSPAVTVHFVREGDHSFQPPRTSDRTREGNWEHCVKQISQFVFELLPK